MDVGGSTTGRVSRRETMYPGGHEALTNWGAFLRANDDGSPGTVLADPIFQGVMSGYRESSALRYVYDEDYALQVDRLLARVLQPIEVTVATLAYVMASPSGRAVKALDRKHPRETGKWTQDEYRMRLDELTGRVDMALTVVFDRAS